MPIYPASARYGLYIHIYARGDSGLYTARSGALSPGGQVDKILASSPDNERLSWPPRRCDIYITRRLIHARIQALCASAIGIYIGCAEMVCENAS